VAINYSLFHFRMILSVTINLFSLSIDTRIYKNGNFVQYGLWAIPVGISARWSISARVSFQVLNVLEFCAVLPSHALCAVLI